MSKAEIEDVLSSIRRLVSENAGALRREQDQGESRDKLVLTPAFRVDEDSAEQDGAEADDDRVETATGEPETPPDTVVADLVEADRAANASSGDAVGAPAETAEYSPPETDDTDHAPRADTRPLSPLEQRIAELEAVVSRSAAEFEPDGSEADELPDTFVFHHQAKERQADAGTLPEQDAALAPVPDQPKHAAPAARAPTQETWGSDSSLAEAAPATESAAPQVEDAQDAAPEPGDAPEPERDSQDLSIEGDEAEVPEAGFVNVEEDDWEDVDAAGFDEAVDVEDFHEEIDDETGIDDVEEAGGEEEDGAVLDEAALREMVARMVREELQGTVGERITHNVRRMVRREIARALSLQEFE